MSGTTDVQSSRWQTVVAVVLALFVVAAAGLAIALAAVNGGEPSNDDSTKIALGSYSIAYEEREAGRDFAWIASYQWQDESHVRAARGINGRAEFELVSDGRERHSRVGGSPWRSEPVGTVQELTASQSEVILLSGATGGRFGTSVRETIQGLDSRDPGGGGARLAGKGEVLGRDCYLFVGGPVAVEQLGRRAIPVVTYRAWVDVETMVVLRWETTIDGRVVVESVATSFEIDPEFAPGTFVRPG